MKNQRLYNADVPTYSAQRAVTSLDPALLNVCWVVGYAGLQILPNGVSQLTDDMGRQSGEAYVQFALASQAEEALAKHKEKMGHRWGVTRGSAWPFPPPHSHTRGAVG